jgi:hypothetical protein
LHRNLRDAAAGRWRPRRRLNRSLRQLHALGLSWLPVFDKVSPNNLPDRLQKWISVVEADGGKVLVEPPPNELVARSPFAALSLIGTLITSIKGFAKFNSDSIKYLLHDTAILYS